MRKLAPLVIIAVFALTSVASANLLLNGDFSQPGVPGPLTNTTINNWSWWGGSGSYNDTINTQMSVRVWWDDTGIYQNFAATAGQAYQFTVDAQQLGTDPLVNWWGYLKAEFYDGSSTKLGEQELAYLTSASASNTWVSLSGIYTAPVGSVQGRIVLGLNHWAADPAGSAYFDNASVVAAIPEPTVAALFGLSGLLLLATRRAVRNRK